LKKFIIINPDFYNLRIDKWLRKNFSSLNQSFIEKNLRKGNIKVNKKKMISKYRLQHNDEVEIFNYSIDIYNHKTSDPPNKSISSKYKKLFQSHTIFENDNFIVLDKWAGIATQGGSKINISIDHIIKSFSDNYNLVHRLDRETSGLLIIAKNLKTTRYFGKLFKDRLIKKIYIATCQGNPKNIESEIELSIADKIDKNKKHNSITRYKVFQSINRLSNIIFSPKTGKTHQIRIVAKHLGCPIIGDTKYNNQDKYKDEKLKLNAHLLNFSFNNKDYEFVSELPEHFKNFFNKNKLKKINTVVLHEFL